MASPSKAVGSCGCGAAERVGGACGCGGGTRILPAAKNRKVERPSARATDPRIRDIPRASQGRKTGLTPSAKNLALPDDAWVDALDQESSEPVMLVPAGAPDPSRLAKQRRATSVSPKKEKARPCLSTGATNGTSPRGRITPSKVGVARTSAMKSGTRNVRLLASSPSGVREILSGAPDVQPAIAIGHLGYRDIEFDVDYGWYAAYRRAVWDDDTTKVMSTGDALAILWETFRSAWKTEEAAGNVSWSDLHKVIGCYNLPRADIHDETTYMFWRDGWGAPHRLFLNACALVYTYVDLCDVTTLFGTDNLCEGVDGSFSDFVRDVIRHKTAQRSTNAGRDHDDHESCTLAIHFPNKDATYAASRTGDTTFDNGCTVSGSCYRKLDGTCDGYYWNDFTPVLDDTYTYYRDSNKEGSIDPRPDPGSGCTLEAYGGGWAITVPPIYLGFDGYVCDEIMFRARAILDYARQEIPVLVSGSRVGPPEINHQYIDAVNKAKLIARYALRIMVYWGYRIIHEIGHTWLGDKHCKWDCCFELAAQQWQCKVIAALGLPSDEYYSRAGDWTSGPMTNGTRNEVNQCSTDQEAPEPTVHPWMSCSIASVGSEGSSVQFCSSVTDAGPSGGACSDVGSSGCA